MAIDLVTALELAGVEGVRLGQDDEVFGKCPGHLDRTGKEDAHPSWSMNQISFLHYCFSCGYSGSLSSLIHELTGEIPVDLEIELHQQSIISKRLGAVADPEEVVPEEGQEILDEWSLRHILKAVPMKLLELRYLTAEAAAHYEVRWDGDGKRWVLPLRAPNKTLVGAQYRQQGSVLTLPAKMKKALYLFGLSQASQFDACAIVESPLDAVRLYQCGIPAVSSLGAFVSREQMDVLARNFSCVIVAMDDDEAGWQSNESLVPGLRKRGCTPIMWKYKGLRDERGKRAKDVGDVVEDGAIKDAYLRTLGG